jgi:predicted O-methyltransferase YrrM
MTAAPSDYEYTNNWFEQSRWFWDRVIPELAPRRIVEIGSYEGRSTCYLIESCGQTRPIEIHCIDTWEGGAEHDKDAMREVEARFHRNIARAERRAEHVPTVVTHKSPSSAALAELIAVDVPGSFDLVYVDGSHQAPDVLADAVLSFQLLRVGGMMIFDDYLWSMEPAGHEDSLNMPKPAIDAFVNIYQRKIRLLRGAPLHQLYAIKTSA